MPTEPREQRDVSPCIALDVGDPVAVVLGVEAARHQEDDVDQPPDAHAAQGQQLSDGGAGLAEAEAVEAEEAEQDGVEERRQEVVVRIPEMLR